MKKQNRESVKLLIILNTLSSSCDYAVFYPVLVYIILVISAISSNTTRARTLTAK